MVATGKTTKDHDERIAKMRFSVLYSCYLNKILKKGRSEKELKDAIMWLTGIKGNILDDLIKGDKTLKEFFDEANLHPRSSNIKGVICGYRIEDIKTPLTKKSRYLDKIVDQLAKGKVIDNNYGF